MASPLLVLLLAGALVASSSSGRASAAAAAAVPFRQSQMFDFMAGGSGAVDGEGSGEIIDVAHSGSARPLPTPRPPPRAEHSCPFGCQCNHKVVQCSDLGLRDVPSNIPLDTTLLDLQGNKLTEIKDDAFKNQAKLHVLILANNKISKIHPKAFLPLVSLDRLYLSKNQLEEVPPNLPKYLTELRLYENRISKVPREIFYGLKRLNAIEMGNNPLQNSGIDVGSFKGLDRLTYIRLSDSELSAIPKGLPASLNELHLDGNKITAIGDSDLKGLDHLTRLGLSHNKISSVKDGSLTHASGLLELHLDSNQLSRVPPGLADLKLIMAVYLHENKISVVEPDDFCGKGHSPKKSLYSAISLYGNPVNYWDIQPLAFRCVTSRVAVQLGNYRK
ncbi:decorin-like [Lampetra planeri]